jgi:hypothetical protein
MDDVLTLADNAMQMAKDQGRNQVVNAQGARTGELEAEAM